MWNLDFCDIYRDGGSLGAVLSQGTKHVSLFLEIRRWDKPPAIPQYENLWVSEGQVPGSHGEDLTAGSNAERHWLRQLENEVSTEAAAKGYKMRFGELVAALRLRNGGATDRESR